MKLSEKEKAAHREAFQKMSLPDKLGYIFSYYKAYIIVPLIILIALGHFIYARITRKEEVLYLALINVAAGDTFTQAITHGFLAETYEDAAKKQVILYPELYLSDNASADNNRYAYASRIKLLGSIEAKKLDAAIVNKEAYDILSHSGYLADLNEFLNKDELDTYTAALVYNDVWINDNRIDHLLDEDIAVDDSALLICNGIDLSAFPLIRKAGFSDTLYLCVIANTQHKDAITSFISYLSAD